MAEQELSSADIAARRCVELALLLEDQGSLTTYQVIERLSAYGDDPYDPSAWRRVSRDMTTLREMGLAVRGTGGEEGRWILDEAASFADVADAGVALAATKLALLLGPLSSDETFPQAEALSRALAKLCGTVGPAARSARQLVGQKVPKAWQSLDEAARSGHELAFSYTDRVGAVTTRVVRPYGTFALNGHLYLVAETCERNGQKVAEPQVGRFRDDRIDRLRVCAASFEPPADVDAGDWCVLPFQAGDPMGPVRFVVPAARRADVLAQVEARAVGQAFSVEDREDGALLSVDGCASWEDTARWAIAEGVTVTEPAEAADAQARLLGLAAETGCLADAPLAQGHARATKTGQRGRPSIIGPASQLLTLAGLFGDGRARVTVDAAAATLGTSHERVRELMDILTVAQWQVGYLPIHEVGPGSSWELANDSYLGRRLRLAPAECQAIEAAVRAVGLPDGMAADYDQVRQAFWPLDGDRGAVVAPQSPASRPVLERLAALAEAIQAGMLCRFAYQGLRDADPRVRLVRPLSLFSHKGMSYLSAYDFGRAEERRFRVDRMGEITPCEATDDQLRAARGAAREARVWFGDVPSVHLRFADPAVLSFCNWEGAVPLRGAGGPGVTVTIPDLGGMWLARHVAAFADQVTTDSPDLAARIRAVGESAR